MKVLIFFLFTGLMNPTMGQVFLDMSEMDSARYSGQKSYRELDYDIDLEYIEQLEVTLKKRDSITFEVHYVSIQENPFLLGGSSFKTQFSINDSNPPFAKIEGRTQFLAWEDAANIFLEEPNFTQHTDTLSDSVRMVFDSEYKGVVSGTFEYGDTMKRLSQYQKGYGLTHREVVFKGKCSGERIIAEYYFSLVELNGSPVQPVGYTSQVNESNKGGWVSCPTHSVLEPFNSVKEKNTSKIKFNILGQHGKSVIKGIEVEQVK